jgi:solute carrier family 25 (mitochondrial oxoglutarate transporter), member 11
MNVDRFFAANAMALITHAVTQPMDLVKTRAQILQEGKGFTGIGFSRGFHGVNIFNDTLAAGGGYKKFFSKLDAWAIRTVSFTTFRLWGFLYFYDWLNPDPRRQAKPDFYLYAGIAGGVAGGILCNPFQVVFSRMQVDEMYPEQGRRNYKSFIDGFTKCAEEGALFRGTAATALKLAGLVSVASGVYDYLKENMFYFFGPISANRIIGTAAAAMAATVVSMPFDTVATRLHTMRPLPNGKMPYLGTFDCMVKMIKYECNFYKQSNFAAFYSGG